MAVIIEMEMPKSCFGCPMATICTTEEGLNFQKRPSDCPLKEVVRCEGCKNWQDWEEKRTNTLGEEIRYCDMVDSMTNASFYCEDGEAKHGQTGCD